MNTVGNPPRKLGPLFGESDAAVICQALYRCIDADAWRDMDAMLCGLATCIGMKKVGWRAACLQKLADRTEAGRTCFPWCGQETLKMCGTKTRICIGREGTCRARIGIRLRIFGDEVVMEQDTEFFLNWVFLSSAEFTSPPYSLPPSLFECAGLVHAL